MSDGGFLSGGGGSLVGSLVGAAGDVWGTHYTNAKNKAMAEQQMRFQKEMSNTAYQRAVKDMRKAGLNPALAYSQGPASSPAGAMATMENPAHGASDKLAGAAQSAMQMAQTKAATKNTEKDTDVKDTTIKVNKTTEELNANSAQKVKEDKRRLEIENDIRASEARVIKKRNEVKEKTAKFDAYVESGRNVIDGLKGIFGMGPLRNLPQPHERSKGPSSARQYKEEKDYNRSYDTAY